MTGQKSKKRAVTWGVCIILVLIVAVAAISKMVLFNEDKTKQQEKANAEVTEVARGATEVPKLIVTATPTVSPIPLSPLLTKLRTYEDETMSDLTVTSENTLEMYTLYNSSLPVIYINCEEDIFINYSSASMYITGNESYGDESKLYDGSIEVKLRGNSTKYREKSPYKIKLDSKTDLFGMGESKHWVLLANDIDHTLIRNKLVCDLASSIGMEFATESVLVSVVINGEYQGVYQLCEHIRVEEERVDIYSWEDLAEDAAAAITEAMILEDSLAEVGDADTETSDANQEAIEAFETGIEAVLKENYLWTSAPYTITYQEMDYDVSSYVTIPEATGGFLLEMDFYAFNDWELSTLITNFKQPLYFNTPGFVDEASDLYQYTDNYIQSFEYALHSDDFVYHADGTHYSGQGERYDRRKEEWEGSLSEVEYTMDTYDDMHYSELFDLDSLVQNFIICEFTMNWDCMKNSMFVYKDLEGRAIMGPVWDFDWSFGNVNMFDIFTYITDSWQTTNGYFTNEQYYQSVQWNRYLIKDPYFVMKVYEKYKEIRDKELAATIASIDTYKKTLSNAGAANDARWGDTYSDRKTYSGGNSEDFTASYDSLQTFISQRMTWMDQQFTSYDSLIESLRYYVKSDKLEVSSVITEGDKVRITAEVVDKEYRGVSFQINGTTFVSADVIDNKATVEVDASLFSEGMNMIQIRALDESGQYLYISNQAEAATISNYYIFID